MTRPPQFILSHYGDPTEDNDRIARLEVRPGMQEGQEYGLMLRMWGTKDWGVRDGQAHYFTTREQADQAAQEWIGG